MAAAQPIDLASKALTWPDQAKALVIVDDATYKGAGEMLLTIKELDSAIVEHHAEPKKKAHEAHRAICKAETDARAPLVEAERIIKRAMTEYLDEQERLARIEAARLEAEAKEREESARLEEAAALEAAGQHEEAERVLVEEPPVPAFVPPAPVARVAGVTKREEWVGELVDMKALCKAIGEGKAPSTLVTINQVALNGLARSMKGELNYPGVRAVSRTGIAAARGRA